MEGTAVNGIINANSQAGKRVILFFVCRSVSTFAAGIKKGGECLKNIDSAATKI
jgi:hypothetical protein